MIKDTQLFIIPQNQYDQIIRLLDRVYEDFKCDQIEPRRTYHLQALYIIKEKLISLLNSDLFWFLHSMHPRYCTHKHKRGSKMNMICGKRIDIKCDDKDGKYKCYKHISKLIYNSKKEKNINELCIGKTKYGKQLLPCKNKKWKDNYCEKHYVRPKKVSLGDAYFKYYFNRQKKVSLGNAYLKEIIFRKEIEVFHNIDIDIFNYKINFKLEDKLCKYCNINKLDNIYTKIYLDKYYIFNPYIYNICTFCIIYKYIKKNIFNSSNINNNENNKFDVLKDEICKINEIEYDINVPEFHIDKKLELNIKYNNGICLEFECFNKKEFNKDLCKDHIDKYLSIYCINEAIDIIDNSIKENKKDYNEFINKININNETNMNEDQFYKDFDFTNIEKNYEIVTKLIENKTYININYLEKVLNDYNCKFTNFKKEIETDFPRYYKFFKGYFEILEYEYKYDIIRTIELAKIKSKIIL